jgi:hypothetical protein
MKNKIRDNFGKTIRCSDIDNTVSKYESSLIAHEEFYKENQVISSKVKEDLDDIYFDLRAYAGAIVLGEVEDNRADVFGLAKRIVTLMNKFDDMEESS